jgi:hypothetical protein
MKWMDSRLEKATGAQERHPQRELLRHPNGCFMGSTIGCEIPNGSRRLSVPRGGGGNHLSTCDMPDDAKKNTQDD